MSTAMQSENENDRREKYWSHNFHLRVVKDKVRSVSVSVEHSPTDTVNSSTWNSYDWGFKLMWCRFTLMTQVGIRLMKQICSDILQLTWYSISNTCKPTESYQRFTKFYHLTGCFILCIVMLNITMQWSDSNVSSDSRYSLYIFVK